MKQIQTRYITLLAAFLLIAATACYKDKGNYSYADTNTVSLAISAIEANGTLNVNQADTLRIEPVITQTLGKDESRFAYEWKIFDNSPTSSYAEPRTVVSQSRNLKIAIVAPNFTLGQRYRMAYKVTDTITQISALYTFNVQVVNRFATGWVVLQDLPNGGDYSMILPGDVVDHKIFAQTNPGIAMGSGTPVRMDIPFPSVDDAISSAGKKFFIYHPNGGIELDYTTLKKKHNLQALFFNPPATLKPQGISYWTYPTQPGYASFGTFVSDRKVYISEMGGYPGAKKFGSALAMANNSPDYEAAPEAWQGISWPIVFDQKNRRFHIVRPTRLDDFPDTVSTVANLNNLGKDLVYMDESNIVRAYNAILKDDAGQRHLLRITFSATDYILTSFIQAMNAPNIEQATAFASNPTSPHIFYGAGNQLYRYEVTSNSSTQPFSFPAGENITHIRFRGGPEMLVATWNGTQGKLYRFTISNTGAITTGTFIKEYTGFGKVIDLRYKG